MASPVGGFGDRAINIDVNYTAVRAGRYRTGYAQRRLQLASWKIRRIHYVQGC